MHVEVNDGRWLGPNVPAQHISMSAPSHAGPGAAPIKGLPSLSGIVVDPSTRIAIVRTRWNAVVVDALVSGARAELLRSGVAYENIVEKTVSMGCGVVFVAPWGGRGG